MDRRAPCCELFAIEVVEYVPDPSSAIPCYDPVPPIWPSACRQAGVPANSRESDPSSRGNRMRILALIGALGLIVAIVAAVFFFGGYYNIAATEQDNGAVAWALMQVRQASIDRHATDTPPGSLTDPATIQAGAKAFAARGCVNCHGGPGAQWAKFSE